MHRPSILHKEHFIGQWIPGVIEGELPFIKLKDGAVKYVWISLLLYKIVESIICGIVVFNLGWDIGKTVVSIFKGFELSIFNGIVESILKVEVKGILVFVLKEELKGILVSTLKIEVKGILVSAVKVEIKGILVFVLKVEVKGILVSVLKIEVKCILVSFFKGKLLEILVFIFNGTVLNKVGALIIVVLDFW